MVKSAQIGLSLDDILKQVGQDNCWKSGVDGFRKSAHALASIGKKPLDQTVLGSQFPADNGSPYRESSFTFNLAEQFGAPV